MASESILKQAYTAVICVAERSVTDFPAVLALGKKRYPPPFVAFTDLSRERSSPENMLMKG